MNKLLVYLLPRILTEATELFQGAEILLFKTNVRVLHFYPSKLPCASVLQRSHAT